MSMSKPVYDIELSDNEYLELKDRKTLVVDVLEIQKGKIVKCIKLDDLLYNDIKNGFIDFTGYVYLIIKHPKVPKALMHEIPAPNENVVDVTMLGKVDIADVIGDTRCDVVIISVVLAKENNHEH